MCYFKQVKSCKKHPLKLSDFDALSVTHFIEINFSIGRNPFINVSFSKAFRDGIIALMIVYEGLGLLIATDVY